MHEVDPLALFHHRAVPGEAPITLLLLHGTGGDEDDLLPLGPYLAPGAALLSPRGRVLENGAPRFFRRIAEGVFDEEDLKHRTDELARFVRAARERYGLEDRPIVAVGFSNGANIAGSLLLMKPEALDGAILLRAMTPFIPEKPPALAGKRVFLGAGRNDPLVPPYESESWAERLRGAGADVTLHWTNTGHALAQEDIDAAREWLRRRFGSGPEDAARGAG
ncbi:MAG: alpha/beta hydrolase [Bacteroidota bacterium]